MLITLSPSKGQDFDVAAPTRKHTKPLQLKDSEELIAQLRKYKVDDIKDLMSVSDNIAELNVGRYDRFSTPFTTKNAKQALFAFQGDVYGGIDVDSFSDEDLGYAQDHLRILSGLYGCLRPLDLIQPYRLEMKTKLANPRGDNLYQFWDDSITGVLNKVLKQQQTPVLVNLASNEYFKSVKPKQLDGDVLNINFKEKKDGKTRIVAIFAKRARGLMTDYIIRNRIEDPADLRGFDSEGYRFSSKLSDESQLTFVRPQPAARS